MRDLRVRDQVLGRRHDFGDAGLVVGAEQRRARRGDDVVADLLGERRDCRRAAAPPTDRRAARGRGRRSARWTIGCDAGAAHLRRGVDVRDEADGRHVRLAASSPGSSPSRSRARRVPRRRGRSPCSSPTRSRSSTSCFGGARIGGRALVGLRVEADVAQEALEDSRHQCQSAGTARRAFGSMNVRCSRRTASSSASRGHHPGDAERRGGDADAGAMPAVGERVGAAAHVVRTRR